MSHQYKTLEDTVYFWFGSNDTSGSGDDGATPVFDVRLAGAAAGDAPILSGAGTLLSHGDYPDGAHEIAVVATAANGFVAGNTYAVFSTIVADSQNPTGFVGSFVLAPVISNVVQIDGTAQRAADLAEIAQYFIANSVTLTDIIADNSVFAQLMASSGVISGYSKVDDALQSIRDAITESNAVWDAALVDHDIDGTMGYALNLLDTGATQVVDTEIGDSGITLAQAKQHLQVWLNADIATASGQSYTIAGRSLTRADADEIRNNITHWQKEVKRLSSGKGGGIRVRGATIVG